MKIYWKSPFLLPCIWCLLMTTRFNCILVSLLSLISSLRSFLLNSSKFRQIHSSRTSYEFSDETRGNNGRDEVSFIAYAITIADVEPNERSPLHSSATSNTVKVLYN